MSKLGGILTCSKRLHSVFALSTGGLPSALAIIRITGAESKQALVRLTRKDPNKFEPRKLFYAPLFDENRQLIDRAMAVFLQGPQTFTGEDTVELYVHGSHAVVKTLLATLSKFPGLEPAKAGEFTRRAFFNSKLNLAQLEALGDLLNAETTAQLRLAHKQNESVKHLQPIVRQLVQTIARLEAAIDFSEDIETQQNPNWREDIREEVEELRQKLTSLLGSTRKGMLIRNGVKVALIGRTNVGKSSLMNQIVSRDVAIVSKVPGTTRDSLEVRTTLANLPITINDTAGLRETTDELENEGIVRSIKRSSEAHIVVFVLGADQLLANSLQEELKFLKEFVNLPKFVDRVICVNKSDLLSDQQKSQITHATPADCRAVFVSALHCNIHPLVDELSRRISTISEEEGQELFLSRERHIHLLEEAVESLELFQGSFDMDSALAAQHLRDAADLIGEIAGTIANQTILNSIFSQFCIGK